MPNNNDGIKTTVGVKGDKEYKAALQQISRQLTVLNTDMKASQSAFGNQADTMGGLFPSQARCAACLLDASQRFAAVPGHACFGSFHNDSGWSGRSRCFCP